MVAEPAGLGKPQTFTGKEMDYVARARTRAQKGRPWVKKTVPRIPHLPQEPSELEKQEHETSGHTVVRSWCVHYVARKDPHLEAGEGNLPEVGVDCGYLGKDRQRTMPLLVAKDRRTQMFARTAGDTKERDDYSTNFMRACLLALGWKRLIIRQTPSLLALLARAAMILTRHRNSCFVWARVVPIVVMGDPPPQAPNKIRHTA